MKLVIEHLRAGTIPHQLIEELLRGNVPFYEGKAHLILHYISSLMLTGYLRLPHRACYRSQIRISAG